MIFQILSFLLNFQWFHSIRNLLCINFLFKGLGRGLACMAIDCLYSLNGGQLSLTRGKFLLFKYSHFSIFWDFNITSFSFSCKQGDNYSLWSVWEIVSFLIYQFLFLIHFTVYFRLFSEISIALKIVNFPSFIYNFVYVLIYWKSKLGSCCHFCL